MSVVIGWTLPGQSGAHAGFATKLCDGVATVLLPDAPRDARARLGVLHRAFQALDPFLAVSAATRALLPVRLAGVLVRFRGMAQVSVDVRAPLAGSSKTGPGGRAFLRDRRAALAQAAAARQAAANMLGTLEPLCSCPQRRVLQTHSGATAHVLVPRSDALQLRLALADAARAHPRRPGHVVVTGPWPPSASLWLDGAANA